MIGAMAGMRLVLIVVTICTAVMAAMTIAARRGSLAVRLMPSRLIGAAAADQIRPASCAMLPAVPTSGRARKPALAHDPEKCERFSDRIMRKIKDVEHASVSIETDRALVWRFRNSPHVDGGL